MRFSLKNHLTNILNIPESCIVECDEHEFFDPNTGDSAAEWDSIFVINYSILFHENRTFILPPDWPPHDSVFLLEVKQVLHTTAVMAKIPQRISRTIKSLTSTIVSNDSAAESAIPDESNIHSGCRRKKRAW